MRTEKWMALVLALVLCLSGCTLARPDGAASSGRDRLIGAFVSDGPLYIDKGGVPTGQEGDRVDAVQDEEGNWSFPGLDGVCAYWFKDTSDPEHPVAVSGPNQGATDAHYGLTMGDEEDRVDLSFTVYMCPQEVICCSVSPIYQTADDRVYLIMSGEGASYDLGMGEAMGSRTLKETYDDGTRKETETVEVHFKTRPVPHRIEIAAMSADDTPLLRLGYAPGTLPESFSPPQGTAYLVVAHLSEDGAGSDRREIVPAGQSYATTYHALDNGFFGTQSTELIWQDA